MGKLLPAVAAVYWIDLHFGQSYMFLTDPYGNPLLGLIWRLTGNRGGLPYIGGLLLMVVVLLHGVYVLYRLLRRADGPRGA